MNLTSAEGILRSDPSFQQCLCRFDLFQREFTKLAIQEFPLICEKGAKVTGKKAKIKFMKKAFFFFGIIWCVILVGMKVLNAWDKKKEKAKAEQKEKEKEKEKLEKKEQHEKKEETSSE